MTIPHPEGDHEELETIPWSMLSDELDRGRTRTLVLTVVAGAVLAVVGFIGVRALARPASTTLEVTGARTETEPAVSITADVATAPVVTPTADAPAGDDAAQSVPEAPGDAAVTPPPPALYSEADLMAAIPDEDMRAAAVRAEWFVAEFFSSASPEGVTGLPDGAAPRRIPEGAYSWVEWARASAVEPHGDGRYDVTVVFRTLFQDGGSELAATPPRAVEVPILIDADGAAGVVDLPTPAVLPDSPDVAPLPSGVEELPEAVVASARDLAAAFAPDVEVIEGAPSAGGWRVVVLVADPSGARWPLVVTVAG